MCPPFWSTTHCKRRFHYPTLWSMKHRGPWQCVTRARSPASTDQRCQTSSLLHGPKWRDLPDLNLSCWGTSDTSSMQATFSSSGYAIVSRNVRWRTQSCCKVHSWRPLASYAAFTPAQQVARNKLRATWCLLRATSCAGVNVALRSH